MNERTKANFWLKRIDKILQRDARFVFDRRKSAKETLQGIRNTIANTGRVTDKQIQAIKNIKWSKN